MKLKFNNADDNMIDLQSYYISESLIFLQGNGVTENLSGFKLYDDDGNMLKDCSDFVYKWNIYTEYENGIYLTPDEDFREMDPAIVVEEQVSEDIEPLSNDELTAVVANLMYEIDKNKLGLEEG